MGVGAFRALVGWPTFLFGAWIIGMNLAIARREILVWTGRLKTDRHVSGVPLVGGGFAGLGFWLADPRGWGWLWWIFAMIDPFCVPYFLFGMGVGLRGVAVRGRKGR